MKKLKIGVLGSGRGLHLAKNFMMLGCEITALCEIHAFRREGYEKTLGNDVTVYEEFDKFLEHKMDAVVLANNFHEHAPYAIRCLERGLHVYSECTANGTMAEGVALIRAAEQSNAIYMLAENYPQMIFNREMKRICDGGTLGQILYAEGEYNHPVDPRDEVFQKTHQYYPTHWRSYLPRSYYITHSLGPLMHATGATPKRVTSFAASAPFGEDGMSRACTDRVSIVTTQNDDGSIFRVTGCAALGAHHIAYRICGTEGQVENLRGMGDKVMLRYNEWSKPEQMPEISFYEPAWNGKDEYLIKQSGHGGADFLTARMFVECVTEGKQPPHPFDVHSAVTMASVGILAHRSMLEGGVPYVIPDFHTEDARKEYENDYLSPFYGSDGSKPTLPCCSHPERTPR